MRSFYKEKIYKIIVLNLILLFVVTSYLNTAFADEFSSKERSIHAALNYLKTVQNADGGFPAIPGGKSSNLVTAWVVMALRSVGENPVGPNWTRAGKNPVDFMVSHVKHLNSTTDCARTILAAVAAGQNPTSFSKINLIDRLIRIQKPSGQFAAKGEEGLINAHVWSILALKAALGQVPNAKKAVQWLKAQQNDDGGFGYAVGFPSDPDSTAAALQALMILGENGETINKALNYIFSLQKEDGGIAYMSDSANVATAAWALQALAAAGEDLAGPEWKKNRKNLVDYVLNLQNEDGSFQYKKGVDSQNVWMTAYAILGLSGMPFPQAVGFRDVSPNSKYEKPVNLLVRKGILRGYPDHTFLPDNPVTRAEFAKIIVKTMGLKANMDDRINKFYDLPVNHWANPYVKEAVRNGLLKGTGETSFSPDQSITGAQLAAVLVRALNIKPYEIKEGEKWYEGYVKRALEKDLLFDEFDPEKKVTRGQLAVSIKKLLKMMNEI